MGYIEQVNSDLGVIGDFSTIKTIGAEMFTALPGIDAPRWIIPLKSRDLYISSLAIYQPSLLHAKILKQMAVLLAELGVPLLMARNRVYFKRSDNAIKRIFDRNNLYYALFTGTRGAHKKITVQVMDEEGIILGYIKVSNSKKTDVLLDNESEFLNYLYKCDISSAMFPTVIYRGPINDSNVLILGSAKSRHSYSRRTLSLKHIEFLTELFQQSLMPVKFKESSFSTRLNIKTEELQAGYDKALEYLHSHIGERTLPFGLCHRDYTPWNTFFNQGKLFVFDWEYSQMDYPPLFDIFHFIVQDSILVKHLSPERIMKRVYKNKDLIYKYLGVLRIETNFIASLFLCYLLDISLFYIERDTENTSKETSSAINIWADMMSLIMEGNLGI